MLEALEYGELGRVPEADLNDDSIVDPLDAVR